MKKLILVMLLTVISTSARAEWTKINCQIDDQYIQNSIQNSIIVEFDDTIQKVRFNSNNNTLRSALITNNFIYFKEGTQETESSRIYGTMRWKDSKDSNTPIIFIFNCSTIRNKF